MNKKLNKLIMITLFNINIILFFIVNITLSNYKSITF